ncbi:hypothetical protein EPN95_04480 [Patescibacteria group bacterium]|nr:MAG: hypothetical protein EPN95_04480 [Patescibacteria group bacterium]
MGKYNLKRSCDAPVAFEGEILAEAGGKWQAGRELNRWHDITAYRTRGGRYILQIGYRTLWQGEEGHDFIFSSATLKTLVEELVAYDPTGHVAGFPPGDQFHEKQTRLLAGVKTQYDARVAALLAAIPGAEEMIE